MRKLLKYRQYLSADFLYESWEIYFYPASWEKIGSVVAILNNEITSEYRTWRDFYQFNLIIIFSSILFLYCKNEGEGGQ